MKFKFTKALVTVFLFVIPILGSGQIGPNLKSAGDFAILAATEISFAPPMSTINDMDVGLYPGVRSSITGDVANLTLNNGAILAFDEDPDNRLPDAKQHLLEAYLFAESLTVPAPATISGNQGGETLAPGIWKSESSLSIGGTPLYLDAGGNENAVWIFQIGSTLTTTSGGDVILTNGAQAHNVFWQVSSSATIGGTDFKGNILALVSITMDTGSTIDGRLLARNGAVTFAGGGTMNNPDPDPVADDNLIITKTATPKTFSAVGNTIEYEIVVTNSSTVTITNINVVDELTLLNETIPSLDPGVTVTYTTSYTITQDEMDDGFFANIATAEYEDGGETISVSAYEVVIKEGLLISKVATPKTYDAAGQVINYEIIVENTGTESVTFTVDDDLIPMTWVDQELGPLQSLILTTTYTIQPEDMDLEYVENTATATTASPTVTVSATETVTKVDPPPPIPLSTWALVLGGFLIAGFVAVKYRRSTPKRV